MTKLVKKIFSKSLDENFTDYSNETTIHGVKYLANRSRPLAERIFWIIIFIISITFLGYFVFKIGRTWLAYPVMITEENSPTQIFEIPFPAITICPQAKFKQNKLSVSNSTDDMKQFTNFADLMNTDFGLKYIMASQICRKAFFKLTGSSFQDISGFVLPKDWIKILHDISPKLEEVFDTCELSSWGLDTVTEVPTKKNCQRLFSTIITNEGICFTFNTIRDIFRVDSMHTDYQYHNITESHDGWDPENGYTKAMGTKAYAYPYKGIVKGKPIGTGGLKFVLNANLSDASPFCYPQNIGYKLTLHSPSAYPQIYNIGKYISIGYGKDYKIAVIPKTVKTNDDLKSFEPSVRKCYYNNERKLKFYSFYNEENCRLECYANYSAEIYGGVPFSSPRDSNTSNCILPYKNFGWELPEYLGLFYEHFKVYGTPEGAEEAARHINCNCLPECNAIYYETKILRSNDDFSIAVKDKKAGINSESIQTTIEIIFDKPTFIGQKRVRMYTFETMISDFGGLMGLFMGGSVLSFFELFYFLTIRNCCKIKTDELPN